MAKAKKGAAAFAPAKDRKLTAIANKKQQGAVKAVSAKAQAGMKGKC
jgi:hypothetical protein